MKRVQNGGFAMCRLLTRALRMTDSDSLGTLFGKDYLSAEGALRSLLAAKHVVDAGVAIRTRSTRQNVN